MKGNLKKGNLDGLHQFFKQFTSTVKLRGLIIDFTTVAAVLALLLNLLVVQTIIRIV